MRVRQESFIDGLIPDYGKDYGRGPDSGHANRGMTLERAIEYTNAQYAQHGIAVICKLATPMTPIRDRKTDRVVTVKPQKSTVDYMGRIGARPIAFEAKANQGATIALDRLQPHQAEFLKQWGTDQPNFVLVSFNALNDAYVIPTLFWLAAVESRRQRTGYDVQFYGMSWRTTGKASLRADELPDEWRVEVSWRGVDYAPVVRRIWRD